MAGQIAAHVGCLCAPGITALTATVGFRQLAIDGVHQIGRRSRQRGFAQGAVVTYHPRFARLTVARHVNVEFVHHSARCAVIQQLKAQHAVTGFDLQLTVIAGHCGVVIGVGKSIRRMQCRIDVALQARLRIVVADQGGHRNFETLWLTGNACIHLRPLLPALAIRGEGFLVAVADQNFAAIDKQMTVIACAVVNTDAAAPVFT